MQFLRHIFTPYHTNNYRAKILHNTSLIIVFLFVLTFASTTYFLKTVHPTVLGISYSINEGELLQNTNNARASSSLQALSLNPQLSDAARRKAADMFQNDYWAHFSPSGVSPWSFIKAAGYNYAYAGENLAKGFTGSQDVVNAWMNSPSHRENMLSGKYTDVGFAVVEGKLQGEDTVLVVQMFGTPPGALSQNTPVISLPPQKIAAQKETKQPIIVESKEKQEVASWESNKKSPVIDSQSFTKTVTEVFLIFIIAVLALDLTVVERRKIPRIVGHNLDHIILFVLFLVFVILTKTGGVL